MSLLFFPIPVPLNITRENLKKVAPHLIGRTWMAPHPDLKGHYVIWESDLTYSFLVPQCRL